MQNARIVGSVGSERDRGLLVGDSHLLHAFGGKVSDTYLLSRTAKDRMKDSILISPKTSLFSRVYHL